MSKLSRDARRVIDAARPDERSPDAARARVRARLLAQAGVAAATSAALATAEAKAAGTALSAAQAKAATSAALAATEAAADGAVAGIAAKGALSTGLVLKWIGVIGVAGALALGAGLARDHAQPTPSASPSARVAATASALTAPSARTEAPPAIGTPSLDKDAPHDPETPSTATAPAHAAPAIRASASTPPFASAASTTPRHVASAAAEPADRGLEAETDLLRRAQAELRAGRPGSALQALDEHDADFKGGVLHEERRAERILALCAMGRTDDARAEAQRFLAAFPRSPMAERVRSSCGGDAAR
ncbi:putative secreted protein [Minicystis rosea]|nr:putative secreted protein [Minicystis rosea]